MRIAAILISVLITAAIIAASPVGSDAQVPNFQIYFNSNLTDTQWPCQGTGVWQTLYVVCNNFNAWISTVEFGVDFWSNGPLIYLQDVHNPGALYLGQSYQAGPGIDGVTITYPIPGNGYGPFIAMRIWALWQCDECAPASEDLQPITVVPHQTTGNVLGIEFNTFRVMNAIGMSSFVCSSSISTEETTWGGVKALYR